MAEEKGSLASRLLKWIVRDPTTGCWVWTGARGRNGYARIQVSGRSREAHRIAYTVFVGPIDADLNVCHTCDNRACINPGHLFVGTDSDNMADSVRKGRRAKRLNPDAKCVKLSDEQIQILKALRGTIRQREIAVHFGVSQGHVSEVQTGRKRKYG